MGNDVVTVDREQPPRLPSIQAGGAVRALVPQDFDSAWRIANAVTKAGMAPYGLETPEKAMVAIMHGLEVGLTPMAALQSIAVVNGRPTLYGDGALGLVRASGLLESIEETIVDKGDDIAAVCRVKRKGEGAIVERTFSKKDAQTAHLWDKRGRNGQETPWQTYPKRMLAMRARAFALRDGFADVLKGLGIKEEVDDIPPRDVTPPPPAPPPAPAPVTTTPEPEQGHDPSSVEIWDGEGEDMVTTPPAAPPPPSTQPPTDTFPDIPPELDRRKTAPGPGVETTPTPREDFDGEDWLMNLDGAFSGVEDNVKELVKMRAQYMDPHFAKANAGQKKRANELYIKHHMRVTGMTLLDAG